METTTTWKTAWGWRARRIPGVFFPTQAEANDAYIANAAQEFVVTQQMLDELEDLVREMEDLERQFPDVDSNA